MFTSQFAFCADSYKPLLEGIQNLRQRYW